MAVFETNDKQEIQSIKNQISKTLSDFEDADEFCGKSKRLPFEEEKKLSEKLLDLYGLEIAYAGGGYLLFKAE